MAAIFCLDKTTSPDPAAVGQPITFTITGFCKNTNLTSGCFSTPEFGISVTDTLPDSVLFVSVTASGTDPATCTTPPPGTLGGTVTCAPETFCTETGCPTGSGEIDYVEKIVVIPTRCGTFTNTAAENGDFLPSAQTSFTVTCSSAAPHHHKKHHHGRSGHHEHHKGGGVSQIVSIMRVGS